MAYPAHNGDDWYRSGYAAGDRRLLRTPRWSVDERVRRWATSFSFVQRARTSGATPTAPSAILWNAIVQPFPATTGTPAGSPARSAAALAADRAGGAIETRTALTLSVKPAGEAAARALLAVPQGCASTSAATPAS